MTYACELAIFLLGSDGMSIGSARLDLPFAPYPGLAIYGVSEDADGGGLTIKAVTWLVEERRFLVDFGHDEPGDVPLVEMKAYYGGRWEWRDV